MPYSTTYSAFDRTDCKNTWVPSESAHTITGGGAKVPSHSERERPVELAEGCHANFKQPEPVLYTNREGKK